MKVSASTNKITELAIYGLAIILLLVPFHALLTVFLSSQLGHYDALRIWKEALLVPVAGLSLWVFVKKRGRLALTKDRLARLIAVYAGLVLALGVVGLVLGTVNLRAALIGTVQNLRFLLVFLSAYWLASIDDRLKRYWQPLLLGPAVIVIGFGLLQQFALPHDFLRHFGYGPDTIPVSQTVDLKPQYLRLQSTQRGPNTLGVYLVLIMTALAGWCLSGKRKILAGIGLAAGSVVLFFTYSRSALGAAIVSIGLMAWLSFNNPVFRRRLAIAATCLLLAIAATVVVFRENDTVQNIFFHTDENSSSSRSTNFDRSSAIQAGLGDIVTQPLGTGTGSAGPASAHNDQPARIAENYYLQIGQETGLLGLTVFVMINLIIGRRLWLRRTELTARIIFASFVAIGLINLVSHAWTDDTIAYLFWSLCGITLSSAIIVPDKANKNETK